MDSKIITNKVIDYIKKGEKNSSEFSIGTEFEHFIIDNNSFKTISFYNKNGVEESIRELCNIYNGLPHLENGYMLGFESEEINVSTEPGSQFEVSINYKKTIKELVYVYKKFINNAYKIFASKNQSILALGYHPKTKIDEIKILPKNRYEYMYNHFKEKGTLAYNMMKGTSSVQISIDYKDENDFKLKYFVASAISPILYSLFDNSPIFENEIYKKHNLRQTIWENTDNDRSGLLSLAFDKNLSYERYAEFIINNSPIFIEKDGKLFKTEEKFKNLYINNPTEDFIFHMLSIVFPDIRVKNYLEFRMFDSVNFPLNFSAVALIKGLFYSQENLHILYELFEKVTYQDVMAVKEKSKDKGLNTIYLNKSLLEHGKFLVELASKSLTNEEKEYLKPLINLLNQGLNPKDKFLIDLENKAFKETLMSNRIEEFYV
ncbi:MAG: glutamate-cysteine ligase family protein [Peptoniphilaceae bacterium]